MNDKHLSTGAKHERQSKLDGFQHEANIKRWPVRHDGETNGRRSVLSTFPDLIEQPQQDQTKTYDNGAINKFQAIANNVVEIASRQPEYTTPVVAQETAQQQEPQISAPASDLDAIRRSIASIHDQEAA